MHCYIKLNKGTINIKYPLHQIDDLIDKLQGTNYFSMIDLRSRYHKHRVIGEDVPEIKFWTTYENYEFLVMSFGLINAPALLRT